jgi:uncharacterized protein YgiM (DUF1202 family)
MNKIKKISIIFILFFLLVSVKCFATTGTVNAPNGLILRETASKTGKVVITISDKASVEIIEKTEDWYKVKYNNYEGYLFAEYVDATEEQKTETTATTTEQSAQNTTTNTETEQTEVAPKTYPIEITTTSSVKVYLIPSVTANVISNIETRENS